MRARAVQTGSVRAARVGIWLWLAFIATSSSLSPAAQIAVYTTNDSGTGSLRQAILDAMPGDTIVFQIPTYWPGYNPATGFFTIGLTSAELAIAKDLTIDGGGQRIAIQRATATRFRIFNVLAGSVSLLGLTVTNGDAPTGPGGGINNAGTLQVRGCTINGNGGRDFGSGISNAAGASLTVENCTLTDNDPTSVSSKFGGSGGGIYNAGALVVRSCTIVANRSVSPEGYPGVGGGIFNADGATAIISNTIIANNTAGSATNVHGAVSSEGYNLIGDASGSSGFTGPGDQVGLNTVQVGLSPLRDHGGPTLTMRPLPGSFAIDQGKRGVDANNQPINVDQRGYVRPVDHPLVTNVDGGDRSDIGAVETAPAQGGPTFVVTNTDDHSDGTCDLDDCTLREAITIANADTDSSTITFVAGLAGMVTNSSSSGGYNITFPLTIVGPSARQLAISGGNQRRIFNILSTSVDISGLTLSNGRVVDANGAAINNNGVLSLTDCTITNSIVANGGGGGGSGGGLYNASGATATLVRCTFSANSVDQFGGGVFSDGTLTVTNCTFSGNVALRGGGLITRANGGNSFSSLSNCTITNNTATSATTSSDGGGGYFAEGGPQQHHFANCIIAGNFNSINPDVRGQCTSDGNNLIGATGVSTVGFSNGMKGDKVGTQIAPLDARFITFANHGGPTDTWSLLPDSPAVNAGNDTLAPPTDQRFYPRVGVSDMGAYEFGAVPATVRINSITRLPSGEILLVGTGVRMAAHSIFASATLDPDDFIFIGTAAADAFGVWQFPDAGAIGLTSQFYRATFP